LRKTRATKQGRNLERKTEVAKITGLKSGNKSREEERRCEKHGPQNREEISRGRQKLLKSRAVNQEINLERKREVVKNTGRKSGKKSREEERRCEKHAPQNREEISRGRQKLLKSRAINQERNLERKREVAKNTRHK